MIYDFIKTIRADQARRMLGVADEGVVWGCWKPASGLG
jgi:hypothetical protein